LFYTHIFNIL